MSKYIDADKLIAEILALKEKYGSCVAKNEVERCYKGGRLIGFEDALNIIKKLQQEQPVEGLENFNAAFDKYMKEHWTHGTQIKDVARHFYELGCRRTAEMYDEIEYNRQRAEEAELSEDLEGEIRRWIHAQRNNGRKVFGWIDMVELAARHFAEWGKNNLK